jgi:hypothetical protein
VRGADVGDPSVRHEQQSGGAIAVNSATRGWNPCVLARSRGRAGDLERVQAVDGRRWCRLHGYSRCESAHSCRILFTQILGGMSSIPRQSVLREICRWSASPAWSLKS